MKIIIENQYLSPVYLYSALYKIKHIEFEQYESFQKMSFRNRCLVTGAAGPIPLSIPLEGGREQSRLTIDVRIANKYNWQEQHWRTIQSCYNRAPWFEFYADELKGFYQKTYDRLFDFNLELFRWAVQKLKMEVQISLTDSYRNDYSADQVLDLRNNLTPRNYAGLESIVYQQVFMERTGFIPNLSILDLIFCKGESASMVLSKGF